MAKHAARRKPGAIREAAWPETGEHSRPGRRRVNRDSATDGDDWRNRIWQVSAWQGRVNVPLADRLSHGESAIDAERNAAIAMGEALTSGFRKAVQAAVREAHAEGLAVPVRVDGIAVEIRPDGAVVPIDDHAPWSPVDWRKAATR